MASWETIARRSFLMMSGTCSLEEYHRMAAEKLRALSRSARILTSGRTGATAVAVAQPCGRGMVRQPPTPSVFDG